ncbi:hypothetical protein B0H13DRAFT_1878991 [Mycena leptocephala]|nr:hypothetical protein B0H13DRAFT_1878991 [Mycena leptocephala]
MTTDGTDNSKHMAPTSCSLTRTRSRHVNLTSTPHPVRSERLDRLFFGCRDFTLDFNEASQNPDNVEKEAQPCTHAHIFRGATAGDHREFQVEARNFLPETLARLAYF